VLQVENITSLLLRLIELIIISLLALTMPRQLPRMKY
jgi:hypothetical protein